MAKYPIKMLKDEDNVPFVPLVGTDAIVDPSGMTLQEKLNVKLEKDNIIAGDNVTITEEDGNLTISTSGKGTLIDNLDTDESGLGGLDAHQGKVLKEMIPAIANNLTTIDATQTLSAYQGYILNNRVVPKGGDEGQVLKKSADGDWQLEWGDAADPNAIIGDGTIKKIVYLTWDEYKALEIIDEYTEYHIADMSENSTLLNREDIQDMIDETSRLYLPLTGGSLTGKLDLMRDQFYNEGTNKYALNLNNSDIIGADGIYFADEASTMAEGLRFYVDGVKWDSLAAYKGKLYFSPGDTLSSTSVLNGYEIIHKGNSTAGGCISSTGVGNNDRYWVHLCHIRTKDLPQGMMWKMTIAMGAGNNGTTTQNCYADVFFQTGWTGSSGGRPGVNYEFHPLSTGLTSFTMKVTTDDSYNYDVWCYKVAGYSRFNYWYNIDSRYIEITDTSSEYQTETPTGATADCNIQGGIVSYTPFTI